MADILSAATPAAAAVLHYAPNANFDGRGAFRPKTAGFDLADVSDPRQLAGLPDGVKGLLWVGSCAGADRAFVERAAPVIDSPKLFGFYLMDDPDPTGRWARQCPASALRAEADWIHSHRPGALTFIALMNLSSASTPYYGASYRPDSSHVDLFGVSPYPCRSDLRECDYSMIDRFFDAAIAAGVPRSRIVPIFQTFGCGRWRTDASSRYEMPTAVELQAMIDRWRRLAPAPVFDFAYSWGAQRDDLALDSSAALRGVMAMHNRNDEQTPSVVDPISDAHRSGDRAC